MADYYDIPIVEGRIIKGNLVITCPYCGRKHYHGIGGGHRVAHCNLPNVAKGYYIKIIGGLDSTRRGKNE